MKTVKIVGQGVPCRLSDNDAAVIVGIGDGEYCPKSVWKEWAGDDYWAQRGGRQAMYGKATSDDYEAYRKRGLHPW